MTEEITSVLTRQECRVRFALQRRPRGRGRYGGAWRRRVYVGKEERHIRRCLEKLAPLEPKQVIVVESQKGDRTHEVAVETGKALGWRVVEGECAQCLDRRALAQRKIDEWLVGVDEVTFEVALEKLVDDKASAGEYRFKRAEERELAIEGAKRFYREFSQKIVELSDGRCVYFAPDERAKGRNANNATSWAEYAFHAVSSSGKLLDGKNFRERLYNAMKAADLPFLESIIKSEQCMFRLIDACPENDAVIFVGQDADNGRLEVVTRLDQFGNAEANLGEVTVIAKHKRGKSPPPKFRPLTEVVETVAKHQAAGFSPSTTKSSVANPSEMRKGVGVGEVGENSGSGTKEDEILTPLSHSNYSLPLNTTTTLHLVWHDWPGLYAKQFNWALDNLPIEGEWILRLDADEYLTEETIARLRGAFGDRALSDVAGLTLELKRRFCGGEIRHGTNGIRLLRIWRRGMGRSEERAMDEHIEVGVWEKVKGEGQGQRWRLVSPGVVVDFDGAFYDDNLNDMDWWRAKHRGYAKREAADALAFARGEIWFKPMKEKYYRLPPYIRAVVYFCIRYFLKRGFLDGRAGWQWNFWQGLWYRWIVDREIARLRKG